MIDLGPPPKFPRPAIILPRPAEIIRPGDPRFVVPSPNKAMFVLTALSGFGAGGSSLTETLWDRTQGTNIGDVSGGGGLTAVFDGTTNQAFASCGQHPSASVSAYAGKTFGTAQRISKIIAYGSNDNGFVSAANPACSLTIYGKNGAAPSNGTNGTAIGTLNFTDTANESAGRTITCTDQVTTWDHAWVYWLGDGSGGRSCFAEVQIYVLV